MKRFASVLLLFAMLLTMIGCANTSEIAPPATAGAPTTGSNECAVHDFAEATFIAPRTCKLCKATEGEPLSMQCDTWEEIVAAAGFDKFLYDSQVISSEDYAAIFVTINDDRLFATPEAAYSFMTQSYLALLNISWFAQDRLGVNTPEAFRVHTTIELKFPDGTITCVPQDNAGGYGFTTMLTCEEGSPNAQTVQSVYDEVFASVKVG